MAYLVNKWASFEIKFTLSKQKNLSLYNAVSCIPANAARNKVTGDFFADQDSLVSTLSEDKKDTLNLESRFADNRLPRDFPSNQSH